MGYYIINERIEFENSQDELVKVEMINNQPFFIMKEKKEQDEYDKKFIELQEKYKLIELFPLSLIEDNYKILKAYTKKELYENINNYLQEDWKIVRGITKISKKSVAVYIIEIAKTTDDILDEI